MRVREALAALVVATPFVMGVATTDGPPVAADDDVVLRFADPDIVESSGLVATDDTLVTVNDSGDAARAFVVDRGTGETVRELTWPGDPVDVEALAPAGPDAVWVGDIGDNTRSRESAMVHRVPLDGGPVDSYELVYPDGPRDAESLLADPVTGRLLVVSKVVFGGQVYAAPAELSTDRPNRLTALGDVTGIATDAAFMPDGRHLLVRTYTQAVAYAWPSLESVGSFALPAQDQGEGIAVTPDGEVLVSSEGVRAPVLRVRLPADVRRAMRAPGQPADEATPAADAGSSAERTGPAEPPLWPWVAGIAVLLGCAGVAVRASRPRR